MIYKTLSLVFLAITLTFSAPEPKVLGKSNPEYIFKKEEKKSEPLSTTAHIIMGSIVGLAGFSLYRYSQYKRLNK